MSVGLLHLHKMLAYVLFLVAVGNVVLALTGGRSNPRLAKILRVSHNFGALMIEDRTTGRALGQVAINGGPLFPEWELGWLLYPAAEGRGLAFEAASTLQNWARETRRLPTLVSYVDPGNHRSRRLAERLGAVQDAAASRPDPADLVYRHFGTPQGTAEGAGMG